MPVPADSKPCPKCKGQMELKRLTPRLGEYPALATYICDACGHVETSKIKEQ